MMSFPMLLSSLFAVVDQAPTTMAITILMVLLIFYIFSRQRRRLPPGPFPWPIVGNLLQMGELAHRTFHDIAKKYGPIASLKLGSVTAIVISSPEMAKEVLKTQDLIFASRPYTATAKYMFYNFMDVVFTPYGPYLRQMKKLCMVELLNAKKISSMRELREEEVCFAIRSVWEKSREGTVAVNLSQILSSLVQSQVLRLLCGDQRFDNNGEEVKKMLMEATTTAAIFNIGDFIPWLDWLDLQGVKRRMKKVHKSFDQLMSKIIEQHRQRASSSVGEVYSKDIIDALLEMQAADSITITDEHVKAVVLDIFVAGVETSTTTLEWAISALIQSPSVGKKLQAEIEAVVGRERAVQESDLQGMEYLFCVVKETLRLYPPVPLLLPHESTKDCTVNGYFIPKRSRTFISTWALGRDPALWKDPLEFRPERFMGRDIDFIKGKDFFDVLPFGAGRRGCPGANMAFATLTLALGQLIHCFDWTVEGELDMMERIGVSLARKFDILVVPSLRLLSCP
ncbi:cytochrome P450 750A1 [Cryptomeria japonica]|uniref:cytochrome P450 750A1 n=1 Tax=Cryptomeria japonica TaxID=3369 RepID=UPI0027DA3F82|nr:cytochrome P450 750A1 [Cryptomeria japonica]